MIWLNVAFSGFLAFGTFPLLYQRLTYRVADGLSLFLVLILCE